VNKLGEKEYTGFVRAKDVLLCSQRKLARYLFDRFMFVISPNGLPIAVNIYNSNPLLNLPRVITHHELHSFISLAVSPK